MSNYDNLLAWGFALGVWRGLIEGGRLVDQWFGKEDRGPLELLDLHPWIRPALLIGWLAFAASWSNTFRGFLHTAGMPLGLYFIGKTPIPFATRLALSLSGRWKLPEKRTRALLTAIGLTLAIASCVPTYMTDPCHNPDADCEAAD